MFIGESNYNLNTFLKAAAVNGLSVDHQNQLKIGGKINAKTFLVFEKFLTENDYLLEEKDLISINKILNQIKKQFAFKDSSEHFLSQAIDKVALTVDKLRHSTLKNSYSEESSKKFDEINQPINIQGSKNSEPMLSEYFKEYKARPPQALDKISEENKNIILENLDNQTREIAKLAFNKIRCISFIEFQEGLRSATAKLCKELDPSEKFIILYDPVKYNAEKGVKGKSGIWTTKLAYNYFEEASRKPMRVEEWSWFDNRDILINEEDKDMSRIIIFDDASYSGTQMKAVLEKLKMEGSLSRHFPKAQITFVVPYITEEALELLRPTHADVFFHEKMAPFPKELNFRCNNSDFKGNFTGSTSTYMQHKVAAGGHSTIPLVEVGLLKEIIPPYVDS